MVTNGLTQYSIIYKDEVEELAMKLKDVIHDMEKFGDRYYSGRPINIQDAVRHARVSHQRLMKLRDHTVRRAGL